MATIDTRPARRTLPSIDIAGVAWPVHKVHALVVGMVVAVVLAVVTRDAQIAVVAATAVTTGAWWVLRVIHAGPPRLR